MNRKEELNKLLDEEEEVWVDGPPTVVCSESLLADMPRVKLLDILSKLLTARPEMQADIENELRHQDWVAQQEVTWAKAPDVVHPGLKVVHQAADPRQLSRVVPLRLTESERIIWSILNQSLEVSEYTDKVDVYCSGSKVKRMATEINQLCAIVSGLVVAHTYDRGQKCVAKDFKGNSQMYQRIFELGRRVKILNPTQMRSTYGKLMWMLMDSCKPEIEELLGFNLVCDIRTVHSLLCDKVHGEEMLADPLFLSATHEIAPEGRSRSEIAAEVRQKEDALRQLKEKYGRAPCEKTKSVNELIKSFSESAEDRKELTPHDVELCVQSVADYNAFARSCIYPVERMIGLLEANYSSSSSDSLYTLEIRNGQAGSCLSHSHSTHFRYVHQSLSLWRGVMGMMFSLWHCTEQDLLQTRYRLADTGQGLNRVQSAPTVSKTMHRILHETQASCDQWVGLSVVHLGDRDVPNALFFIDKYSQVPRILAPIVQCIERIPVLEKTSPALASFIDSLGGSQKLAQTILTDFFRHGFDGSGDDGGSCVDGRLTSCWNWCSKIEKKKYFPAFLLTGFTGFDG